MMRRFCVFLLGISMCSLIAGCGANDSTAGTDDEAAQAVSPQAPPEAHDHSQEGPHGGHMIVIGNEEYHAELLHDEATHKVTVHILDSSGKQEVSIDQPVIELQVFQDGKFVKFELKPSGDTESASEYSIVDDSLVDLLLHSEELRGRLNVTIADKEYVAMIEHHAHEHEGHDEGTHAHDDE